MTRIAFVTCSKIPRLTADDRLCVEALCRRGIAVDPALWDDATIPWKEYDSVVLRSTWDYHLRPAQFRAWLEHCQRDCVRLWNPAHLVRWNMEKTYLRELSARGVAIPPCVWIDRGTTLDLATALQERGWDRAVLKPTISASSHQTYAVTHDNAHQIQQILPQIAGDTGAVLQEFMAQVEEQGEWSLLFFNGEFSHAVLKTPQAGDFRVQAEFGGKAAAVQPAPVFLSQAKRLLNALTAPTIYARVDACEVDGQLVLTELELIEPDLFLRMTPEAPERFATAIVARLRDP